MLSSLISAGASVLGGLLGNSAAKKQRKAEAAARAQEYKQQKEFAQSGIQWKVQDATKAGVHPLYALGANTISYTPQSVGSNAVDDYSFIGNAGQNIARAAEAQKSPAAKLDTFSRSVQAVQLEGLQLDNDIKRAELASKIATTHAPGTPPGLPSVAERWLMDGQIQRPGEIDLTRKQSPSEPGAPWATAGASPDVMFTRTNTGGYAPTMPENVQEAYENDMIGRWQWMLRNRILPTTGQYPAIPHEKGVEGLGYDLYSGQWYARNLRDYGQGHLAWSHGQYR